MERNELIRALRRMKVDTGSLVCFGCGMEHGCGLHGCAIISAAIHQLEVDAPLLSASETARTELAQRLALTQKELHEAKARRELSGK